MDRSCGEEAGAPTSHGSPATSLLPVPPLSLLCPALCCLPGLSLPRGLPGHPTDGNKGGRRAGEARECPPLPALGDISDCGYTSVLLLAPSGVLLLLVAQPRPSITTCSPCPSSTRTSGRGQSRVPALPVISDWPFTHPPPAQQGLRLFLAADPELLVGSQHGPEVGHGVQASLQSPGSLWMAV